METAIKQLTKNGEKIYVRTSSSAVNCNPNLWSTDGVTLTKETLTDGTTRVVLTEILSKVPTLIDNRTQKNLIASADIGSTYDEVIGNSDLETDSKPLSSASTIKIIKEALGEVIDEIDNL